MKKLILLTLIILILISFLLGLIFQRFLITGQVVKIPEQTLTKAICNSKNQCIDVKIYCQNSKVVKIEPVSELKQLPFDWQDPRVQKKLCD